MRAVPARWLSVALFAIAGCDTSNDDAASAEKVAEVRVATPAPADFGERFTLTGTLTAERDAQLSPRVDGLVARVHVDAGDRVKAGDALIELDAAVGRQSLARVRAQANEASTALAESKRLFDEAQRLVERKYIAASAVATRKAEWQSAQAALASVQASVKEQSELVDRHTLPAPFDGVIAEKLTEVGEWVQRGTPVLSLVAIDRVRLDVRVPQERYADIGENTVIEVFADAFGEVALPARIGAKVPVTDPGARTFLLRLLIEDGQGRLLPGTSARAEIALPASAPALAVSRDALLRQPDGGYSLFVVESGEESAFVARQRSVRVLRDQGDEVAIGEGLVPGERVVVRGNEALRDGQTVTVQAD
ncbi:MAG: efflux RND transporter periplasmic adaptor subunit [Dokdonella sp.]